MPFLIALPFKTPFYFHLGGEGRRQRLV